MLLYCNCLQKGKQFYHKDCICARLTSLCDKRYTLNEKSQLLYCKLPLINKENNEHEEVVTVTDLINVINQQYDAYERLSQEFVANKICGPHEACNQTLRRIWWC